MFVSQLFCYTFWAFYGKILAKISPFDLVDDSIWLTQTYNSNTANTEIAQSRTWGIFIPDTAYFIGIHWSMSFCIIES